MTNPTTQVAPFVSNSIYIPEDDDEARIRIQDSLNQIAVALGLRTIGTYETTELSTGNQWGLDSTSNQTQGTFRKIIPLTLGNATTVSAAHGLSNIIACTRIYGFAYSAPPSPQTIPPTYPALMIPLPQSAPDDVSITVDQTNVNVTTATATYATMKAFIVLEYIRN